MPGTDWRWMSLSETFLDLLFPALAIVAVLWRESPREVLGLGSGSVRRTLRVITVCALAAVAVSVLVRAVQLWLVSTGHPSPKPWLERGVSSDSSWGWASFSYLLWALKEECVLRGAVYQAFKTRTRTWIAAGLSALLFSLIHMYPLMSAIRVFGLGLVLAWLVERTRSLGPATFLRTAFNLMLFAARR